MLKSKTVEPTLSGASIYHPDEWAARVELAACYRIFALLGWTDMVMSHITLRLPDSVTGDALQFLVNPFGLHDSEVCAGNLIRVDVSGSVWDASRYKPNPAATGLHQAIYRGIAPARCIMQSRSTAAIAVASLPGGISPHNIYGAQLHQRLAYHDLEGMGLQPDAQEHLVGSIGNRQAVVLRHHGLLSWAQSLPEALFILWTMQRACEIQLASGSLGSAIAVADTAAERYSADAWPFNAGEEASRELFDALLRQVDRLDTSYKT